ncbi:hypothetical protein LTR37_014477 [Vermiconidia calcicola]|uniref:Uncharacterized protein n=1 Tax=Vermiconidia calcicola TaxID=1690605 RepID=A0ACC3MTE4_9PEZI|nr:hypothetical protein LTR37_014477 [Vermiconidia calcicola]
MSLHVDAYPCISCSAHFADKTEQADHLASAHNLIEPWLCHECPISVADEEAYNRHMRRAHPYSAPAGQRGGYSCPHNKTVCAGCPALASDDMRRRHIKHDHADQHSSSGFLREGTGRRCVKKDCGFSNESYVSMSLHVLHAHAPICAVCQRKFATVMSKLDHEKKVGKDGGCTGAPSRPEEAKKLDESGATVSSHALKGQVATDATPAHEAMPRVLGKADGLGNGASPAQQPNQLHDAQPPVCGESNVGGEGRASPSSGPAPAAQSPPAQQPSGYHPRSPQLPSIAPPGEEQSFQPKPQSSLEPIPQFLTDLGFKANDFNPRTIYMSTVATKKTYQDLPTVPDYYIFRGHPKNIAYGNLVRLATRYSATDILKLSNDGRPQKIFTSTSSVESRLKTAIKWAAEECGCQGGVEEVTAWLNREREKNGLKARGSRKRARGDEGTAMMAAPGARPIATPNKRAKTEGGTAGTPSAAGASPVELKLSAQSRLLVPRAGEKAQGSYGAVSQAYHQAPQRSSQIVDPQMFGNSFSNQTHSSGMPGWQGHQYNETLLPRPHASEKAQESYGAAHQAYQHAPQQPAESVNPRIIGYVSGVPIWQDQQFNDTTQNAGNTGNPYDIYYAQSTSVQTPQKPQYAAQTPDAGTFIDPALLQQPRAQKPHTSNYAAQTPAAGTLIDPSLLQQPTQQRSQASNNAAKTPDASTFIDPVLLQQPTPAATPSTTTLTSPPRAPERPDPHGLRGSIHHNHIKTAPNPYLQGTQTTLVAPATPSPSVLDFGDGESYAPLSPTFDDIFGLSFE